MVDPREQLMAQRWARDKGLRILGTAHSHPSSKAIPSHTDRQLCLGPTLMLILSGLGLPEGREAPKENWGAWWIPESAPDMAHKLCHDEPKRLTLEVSVAGGAEHLGE